MALTPRTDRAAFVCLGVHVSRVSRSNILAFLACFVIITTLNVDAAMLAVGHVNGLSHALATVPTTFAACSTAAASPGAAAYTTIATSSELATARSTDTASSPTTSLLATRSAAPMGSPTVSHVTTSVAATTAATESMRTAVPGPRPP